MTVEELLKFKKKPSLLKYAFRSFRTDGALVIPFVLLIVFFVKSIFLILYIMFAYLVLLAIMYRMDMKIYEVFKDKE
jgi:hypothetical protein